MGAGCVVSPGAYLGPYAVVGGETRFAAEAQVHAHAAIGRRCVIGEGAGIHPHALLYDGTEIGPRSVVHSGAILGADRFGHATSAGIHHKVPQTGSVVIAADVRRRVTST